MKHYRLNQIAMAVLGALLLFFGANAGYWKVRHNLKSGGCWDSITFAKGSGKNLLGGPVNCRSRILDPHPTSDGSSMLFFDQSQEKNPIVEVEQLPNGDIAVTASGELRDPAEVGDEQWLIPGVSSSRVHLKQANARCENEFMCC